MTHPSPTRRSSDRCDLRPALRRRNRTVETGALTPRAIGQGGRATGVEYYRAGTLHRVAAAREVLLAGGALNSPQLLMLSGIGDPEQLQAHGIPEIGRASCRERVCQYV